MEMNDDEFDECTLVELLEQTEKQYCDNNRMLSSDSDDSFPGPVLRKKRCRRILSDSESEDETIQEAATSGETSSAPKWSDPKGWQQNVIPYTEVPGIKPFNLRLSMCNSKPGDFYSLLVPDEMYESIAFQTNIFAQQTIHKTTLRRCSRLNDWKPTNKNEIKMLFGLILYMGLVKLPKVSDYWSNDPMFGQQFLKSKISRNRFELLLRMLHFTDNELADKSDRLYKIRNLVNTLNKNFEQHYTPNKSICVDESMVPFRGRIIFRQYNKQKRHKYGIKVFKLCSVPGYTCKLQIYSGKNLDNINNTPTNVVLSICQSLLNKGHTLYTDNWYTSVSLAEELLKNETHLVGTLRKNRRNIPEEVRQAKLNTGEYKAKENENGITIMKWKDKREVLLLSTKHSTRFVKTFNKRGQEKMKPQIVRDYNRTKGAIDLSDQMSAYSSPLRKTIKWYRKLGIELLLNTAVVNAMILHKLTTNRKVSVVQFRKEIIHHLCDEINNQETDVVSSRPRRSKHELTRKEGPVRKTRKWCQGCYKNNVKAHDRKHAKNKTIKVSTFCAACPSQPHYCIPCFNREHRY